MAAEMSACQLYFLGVRFRRMGLRKGLWTLSLKLLVVVVVAVCFREGPLEEFDRWAVEQELMLRTVPKELWNWSSLMLLELEPSELRTMVFIPAFFQRLLVGMP